MARVFNVDFVSLVTIIEDHDKDCRIDLVELGFFETEPPFITKTEKWPSE